MRELQPVSATGASRGGAEGAVGPSDEYSLDYDKGPHGGDRGDTSEPQQKEQPNEFVSGLLRSAPSIANHRYKSYMPCSTMTRTSIL